MLRECGVERVDVGLLLSGGWIIKSLIMIRLPATWCEPQVGTLCAASCLSAVRLSSLEINMLVTIEEGGKVDHDMMTTEAVFFVTTTRSCAQKVYSCS